MAEVFARETFDPRKHSAVAISLVEKQPHYSGAARGGESHLKNYMVGPNVPPPGLSLRRPITAPMPRRMLDGQLDPQPKVLNKNGKWQQDEVPILISNSQAQPLTATSTFTAKIPGSGAYRSIRPVAAIHTYNDVSPVIQADMVHDTDMETTIVKESTIQRPRTAISGTLRASHEASKVPTVAAVENRTAALTGTLASSVAAPNVRGTSINAFWARQAGTAFNLTIPDLERTQELGQNVVAGSANTRLVGGRHGADRLEVLPGRTGCCYNILKYGNGFAKLSVVGDYEIVVSPGTVYGSFLYHRWKYLPRPVDGDAIYTDYYGRCGGKLDDYYGRAYHVQPAQFSKNRLVSDLDYQKVRASMQGIHTLRTRPGLSIETTIVNGAPDRLQGLTAETVKTARGLHKLQEYGRMKPATERQLRQAWQD